MRWQAWTAAGQDTSNAWSTDDQGHTYSTAGLAEEDVWLRYRHIIPTDYDWELIEDGRTPPMVADRQGELITDFYAYNAFTSVDREHLASYDPHKKPDEYARRDVRQCLAQPVRHAGAALGQRSGAGRRTWK